MSVGRETAGPAGEIEDPLVTLVETIEQLSSARTVEDVAAVIRSAARRISGADGVTFVLRDQDQCYYLDEDAIGPLWKGRRFPLSACISGWAMLNGRTAVISDIYLDDRIPHDAYRPTFVKSLVMTPVRPRNPIAAIGAYWATTREHPPQEVARLQVIARATATALENVQLIASLNESLERRTFLVRELDHRMKNTLASICSLSSQTLRSSASPEAFHRAFTRRIMAMARAHELVAAQSWRGAGLREVVAEAVATLGPAARRLHIEGPDIILAPQTAISFFLAMHELGANAVEHGALSGETGEVQAVWSVDPTTSPAGFELRWTETGGPVVTQPVRRGFGVKMIDGGLAREIGGSSVLTFEPEGLTFRICAPLSIRIRSA